MGRSCRSPVESPAPWGRFSPQGLVQLGLVVAPHRARACMLHCSPASLNSGRRCPDRPAATAVIARPPGLFHVRDQAALSVFAPTPYSPRPELPAAAVSR